MAGRTKKGSVRVAVFILFSHFLVSQVCQKMIDVNMEQLPASFWYHGMMADGKISVLAMGGLLGVVLLLISKCSRGRWAKGTEYFLLLPEFILDFGKICCCFFRH